MKEQIHGGDIYRNKDVTDFSVNSNPLGTPDSVLQAVCEAAGRVKHYPDIRCEMLKAAISRFEKIREEEILCGNGAAELFFAAVLAVRPRKALLPVPSFAEYEKALAVTDTRPVFYELKEEYGFELREDILMEITPDIDMLFLCNPGNPTGLTIEKDLLIEIAEKCKKCGTVLLLDECFIEFLDVPSEYEMKEELERYPNLMIVKAFTKIFCMPGLRLGYCISSNQELLQKMEGVLQPWNVSIPAQEAGIAALSDCKTYIERTRQFVKKERQFLREALESAGYFVYASKANYLFFRGKKGLYEDALKAGFLIRDCGNYRGLTEGYYRIAVREKKENERIAAWLKRL